VTRKKQCYSSAKCAKWSSSQMSNNYSS